MPKLTQKKKRTLKMNVWHILHNANRYIINNPMFVLCVCAVNMVYMLCLKAIPGGIQNPLFVVWIITYYIFWCFFYRYYYGLRPYFLNKVMLGSLVPSTKAMVILAALMFGIALLPMVPLFLGFDDVYMDIYERYLQPETGEMTAGDRFSISDIILIYGAMTLMAPVLICKPYLAWIASLRGQNASFRKIGDKTKGNYWQFVMISALLLYPEALAAQLDRYWHLHNWFDYTCSTIIFIYTNIIFAKIYDFFYLKH